MAMKALWRLYNRKSAQSDLERAEGDFMSQIQQARFGQIVDKARQQVNEFKNRLDQLATAP